MSQSLGERLRDARETKGLSIGDVAEQTRISPLYLESIENDDYKPLPGGIFNKGFVKSYAKFVGIDENEALSEYQRLNSASNSADDGEFKAYRPEVLTDDRSSRSMIPSAILAVVVLGVLTAGVLYFVDYMRRPSDAVAVDVKPSNSNQTAPAANTSPEPQPATNVPELSAVKAVLSTVDRPFDVTGSIDGENFKKSVKPSEPITLEPKQELTINYNRWNAGTAQLALNGEKIALPTEPLDPKDRDRIIFTISSDNLASIWERKTIVPGMATPTPVPGADANVTPSPTPAAVQPAAPARTPARTPSPVVRRTPDDAGNAAPRNTETARPAAANSAQRPPAMTGNRPAAANRNTPANRPN